MSKAVSLRVAAATALRWSVGARFATQIIRWGATIVVIRLLTPEDYGLLAMTMVVISFATLFNELGAAAVIVRRHDLSPNEIGSLQGLVAALNLSLGIIVFLLASYVSALYGSDITTILRVCCLMFLAHSIGIVQEALLIRAMDFKSRALVETAAQISGAVLTLTLALMGFGVWSLVFGMLATRTLKALGFLRLVPERYPWRLSLADIRPHIGYASTIALQRIVYWIPGNVTVMLIGILKGPAPLGLYNVGKDLAFLPLNKLGSVLNEVGFATYARSQEKIDGVRKALEKSLAFVSFAFIPYALLGAALAPEAVAVVLGERWLPVIPIIQLMIVAVPFRALTVQLSEALNAAGDARAGLRIQLAFAGLTTTCVVAGAFWSIEAAAAGWAVSMPLVHAFALREARRSLGLSLKTLLWLYGRSLSVGIIAAGVVMLARQGLDDLTPLLVFASLTGTGAATGAVCMALLDRQRLSDIISFARAR